MNPVPVNAVDDDRSVRRKLLGEVGHVAVGMSFKLGGVEAATVFPLELVVSAHLEKEDVIHSLVSKLIYRVTHLVVPNLQLTLKHILRFSMLLILKRNFCFDVDRKLGTT